MTNKGWTKESARHALAGMGLKTSRNKPKNYKRTATWDRISATYGEGDKREILLNLRGLSEDIDEEIEDLAEYMTFMKILEDVADGIVQVDDDDLMDAHVSAQKKFESSIMAKLSISLEQIGNRLSDLEKFAHQMEFVPEWRAEVTRYQKLKRQYDDLLQQVRTTYLYPPEWN